MVEVSLADLLRDAGEVAALIIDDIQYLLAVHLPVVGFVAVLEAVNHQRIENLCLLVVAVQLVRIRHDLAVGQGQQQVVEYIYAVLGEHA